LLAYKYIEPFLGLLSLKSWYASSDRSPSIHTSLVDILELLQRGLHFSYIVHVCMIPALHFGEKQKEITEKKESWVLG
jgi:hypothetical protein